MFQSSTVSRIFIAAIGLASLLAPACRCDEDDQSQQQGATPSQVVTPTQGGTYALVVDPVRLTPEQMARHIETNFGIRWGYTDDNGVFHNELVENGVPLGGIDFDNAFVRDPSVKVQTVLILRSLAMRLAREVVGNTLEPDSEWASGPAILTLCNIESDRPIDPQTGAGNASEDERWTAQVTDIYWRAFGRPPTQEETRALKAAFLRMVSTESEYPPAGWVGMLYSIFASTEFWTR